MGAHLAHHPHAGRAARGPGGAGAHRRGAARKQGEDRGTLALGGFGTLFGQYASLIFGCFFGCYSPPRYIFLSPLFPPQFRSQQSSLKEALFGQYRGSAREASLIKRFTAPPTAAIARTFAAERQARPSWIDPLFCMTPYSFPCSRSSRAPSPPNAMHLRFGSPVLYTPYSFPCSKSLRVPFRLSAGHVGSLFFIYTPSSFPDTISSRVRHREVPGLG